MPEDNPDYTTVLKAANGKALAVWMRYRGDVGYYIYQSDGPHRPDLAERIARDWAHIKRLEFRR